MRRTARGGTMVAMNRTASHKILLVADHRAAATGRPAAAVRRFRLARLRVGEAPARHVKLTGP